MRFDTELRTDPRNDTPEGWLRCDGSEYSASTFSGFVNNHLLTGKISYKTLTEWQTEYNNNDGNCGYFGYDEENDILKVPCIQDGVFVAQALNSGNISSFNLDQIVNIEGLVLTGEDVSKANPSGAFYVSGTRSGGSVNESETSRDVTFDASRVVNTGDRVQPQHIQYPLFVCVSNTAVPTTEAEYNNFINAINNKLNINGSGATFDSLPATAKENIINLLIADYSTRVSVSTGYVCEYYCYVWFYGAHNGSYQACYINGYQIGVLNNNVYGSSPYAKKNAYAFCKPGDVITFDNGTCYVHKLNGAI